MGFNYIPPPTVRKFMLNDTADVKGIIGPLGSGKTTGCIFELFRRACEQQPDPSGIRRTRYALIRNTLQQLKSTTLQDILQYLKGLARWKVSDSTVHFDFALPDGTRVKSEWILIPLETPEDIRRLLSMQLTSAFIEEFREVDYAIVKDLQGRLARYPTLGVRATWSALIACSNPYPTGSPWQVAFELDRPPGWDLYRQPGGRDPNAENVEHLPPDYYERLCHGATPEWIKVFVDGKNGADMSGQAVFGDSFNHEFHTRPHLNVIEAALFTIGMDLDRNPAALIAQRDAVGRLLVHKEVFAEGMGLENFVKTRLNPVMYERFPGSASIIADPSGVRRSSLSEESSFSLLHRLGYAAVAAPTNRIDPRLRAVEAMFGSQTGGEASVLISESGCPMLIRALSGMYKFKRMHSGGLAPDPEKLHPWSDLADALQYLALGFNAHLTGRPLRSRYGLAVHEPAPPAMAWTG